MQLHIFLKMEIVILLIQATFQAGSFIICLKLRTNFMGKILPSELKSGCKRFNNPLRICRGAMVTKFVL